MSGYGGYEYDNANADSGGGGFLSQSNRESEGGEFGACRRRRGRAHV